MLKYCYRSMFEGCTSLTKAPELHASSLVFYCYDRIFYGCTALNEVDVSFTKWTGNTLNNWLYKVASVGTFKKLMALSDESSNIPKSWGIIETDEPLNRSTLTLTAATADSKVKLTKYRYRFFIKFKI